MTEIKGSGVNEHDVQLIVSLLKDTTTLVRVQQFLKSKEVSSSGGWEDMYSKRILPAVIDGKLTIQELTSFLEEVEEYGNQHIFLFECDKTLTDSLMDQVNATNEIVKNGFNEQLINPKALTQPKDPEVSEIRFVGNKEGKQLLFKIRETRVFYVEDEGK